MSLLLFQNKIQNILMFLFIFMDNTHTCVVIFRHGEFREAWRAVSHGLRVLVLSRFLRGTAGRYTGTHRCDMGTISVIICGKFHFALMQVIIKGSLQNFVYILGTLWWSHCQVFSYSKMSFHPDLNEVKINQWNRFLGCSFSSYHTDIIIEWQSSFYCWYLDNSLQSTY